MILLADQETWQAVGILMKVIFFKEETRDGKNDISAQKETARKSTWLQVQNEHQGWQKGSVRPQAQGQKADCSLIAGYTGVMLVPAWLFV